MMLIGEAEKKGLFECRINLGEFFEEEPEKVYITLGEPDFKQYDRLMKKEQASGEDLVKVMKDCILDHNLEVAPDKRATKEEVMTFLNKFPAALTEALQTWQDSLPLVQRSKEKSKPSAPEPSEK